MSEFEFSTLGLLVALLVILAVYSYWQVYRVKKSYLLKKQAETAYVNVAGENNLNEHLISSYLKQSDWVKTMDSKAESLTESGLEDFKESLEIIIKDKSLPEESLAGIELNEQVSLTVLTEESRSHSDEKLADPFLPSKEIISQFPRDTALDPQFFIRQNEAEHASLMVFEPLLRLEAWMKVSQLKPIQGLDGVIDIALSQPKNKADIDNSLHDLRLDTDLPLHIYGRRSGLSEVTWQPLESGALYGGLRLTLQLANINACVDSFLIQEWFFLAQRLGKRLASTSLLLPNSVVLLDLSLYLHQLAKFLATPLVIQLHKPVGLWAAYEIHQNMTQNGLLLNEKGQYVARSSSGALLFCVLNDVNNPRAQDFLRDALPTMHTHTLSFCLDLARVNSDQQPSRAFLHNISLMADSLQAEYCNTHGANLDIVSLIAHFEVQINAYYKKLNELNLSAGSLMVKRLLRG